MRGLVLVLLLAGCAAPTVQPAPLVAPEALQTCPAGARAPAPPKPPRSVASLLEWAISEDRAVAGDMAALTECKRRLNDLNNWYVSLVQ